MAVELINRNILSKDIESKINDPYFALIHGSGVRLSNIERFAPYALETVDVLMRQQLVFGQRYLFETDQLLFFIK